MQACGISQVIFSCTNVMTEELSNHELHDVEGDLLTISGGSGSSATSNVEQSNHELHDVEGDLLTISGGCGSSATSNVSQYVFTPVGSLHAVCAFPPLTSDVLYR